MRLPDPPQYSANLQACGTLLEEAERWRQLIVRSGDRASPPLPTKIPGIREIPGVFFFAYMGAFRTLKDLSIPHKTNPALAHG